MSPSIQLPSTEDATSVPTVGPAPLRYEAEAQELPVEELLVEELLVEDISIDGMCGVY